jgi:hypothetical protein
MGGSIRAIIDKALETEQGQRLTTVDQSDIRGSVPPDKSSSWSYLSLGSMNYVSPATLEPSHNTWCNIIWRKHDTLTEQDEGACDEWEH